MKDYLTSDERLLIMLSLAYLEHIDNMADTWPDRAVLEKEEGKNLKMARTYLKKFLKGFFSKLNIKEQQAINKRLNRNKFLMYDNYELDKMERKMNKSMDNVTLEREEFEDWCCEVMDVKCKNCKKHWVECDMHKLFVDNLIPEPTGFNSNNCRYAYGEDKE